MLGTQEKGAIKSRLSFNWELRTDNCLSELLVKFARRAGNINPSRDTPLAVLGPLHDARILAALGAGGGFGGVHDLLTVGCLCDLRHLLLLTGMCRQRKAGVLPGVWGVNRSADRQGGRARKSAVFVLAFTSLHEQAQLIEFGGRKLLSQLALPWQRSQKIIP
jgi:hypothetical protein